MKKILSALFFRDAPAGGALFALTLATVGSWLWLMLYHALIFSGCLPIPWLPMWENQIDPQLLVWLVGEGGILLYSLVLCGRFYAVFCGREFPDRWWKHAWGLVLAGCAAAETFLLFSTETEISFGLPLLLCFGWILPAFLLKKVRWQDVCGNALAWTLGAGILEVCLTLVFDQDIFGAAEFCAVEKLSCGPTTTFALRHPFADAVQKTLRLSGNGWIAFAVSGLLLLLAGYLFTARMLAQAEGVKLRRLFGRGTVLLWTLLAFAQLFALGAALWASGRTAERIKALEQRFGRPVMVPALEKFYYAQAAPDAGFWRELCARQQALSQKIWPEDWIDFEDVPDSVSPELWQKWTDHWRQYTAGIAALEQRFTPPVPLPERKFQTGRMASMLLPELRWYRVMGRLERWRLEFAVRNGDLPEIRAALRRMSTVRDAASRACSLIGGLVWIASENIRLDGLERALESRLLSDVDLQDLSEELARIEEQVPVVHERAFYSEAVSLLDVFAMLECGGSRPDAPPFPVGGFRWLLPQLWWQFALDRGEMARRFLASDFTRVDATRDFRYPVTDMVTPAIPQAGNRFYALTARLRAMQTLIRAERYRIKHGEFPKTLPDLPLDPFTGKPLHYRVGATPVSETSREPQEDRTRIPAVSAVQVWSVGPNRRDDSGLSRNHADDVRAMIRLKPAAANR